MARDEGVYGLITKLCENQLSVNNRQIRSEDVRKLRAKAFERLLFHRKPIADKYWLEDCGLETQYLAWQFHVAHTFKQPELARQLGACYQKINDSSWDETTKHSILQFLMRLRKPPQAPEEQNVIKLLSSGYRIFTEEDFRLGPVAPPTDTFSDVSFDLRLQSNEVLTSEGMDLPHNPFTSTKVSDSDVASMMECGKRRTWESLGRLSPTIEKPSLSDAPPDVYANVEKMRYSSSGNKMPMRVLTKEQYMWDLKCVVLGIATGTFLAKDDSLVLNPDVRFEGISRHVFERLSRLLIHCGICFLSLKTVVDDVIPNCDRYGAICFCFCSAVRRYLLYYHAATYKFENHLGLLKLHAYLRKLSQPLSAVASICKVGPYREGRGSFITSGVDLLNCLHRRVLAQPERDTLSVLLGLLFPCFQIYFIRYLRPWLLDGVLNDPHNEFFIKAAAKYVTARERSYWTKAFAVCNHLVPNFLVDYTKGVLDCGKTVMLLKQCMPKSVHFTAPRRDLVHCCITAGMLRKLERSVQAYELEVILANRGRPFSLRNWLSVKHDEKLIFNKSLAAKRAASVKRIQQQRLDQILRDNKAKKERQRTLREEYDKQLALKQEQKVAELAREMKEDRKLVALELRARALIQEEAARMIACYEALVRNAGSLNEQGVGHVADVQFVEHIDPELTSKKNAESWRSKPKVAPIRETVLKPSNNVLTVVEKNKTALTADNHVTAQQDNNDSQQKENKGRFVAQSDVIDHSLKLDVENAVADCGSSPFMSYLSTPNFELLKTDTFVTATATARSVNAASRENPYSETTLERSPDPFRLSQADVEAIQIATLGDCIRASLTLPLQVQSYLVHADVLQHFIVEQKLLGHLENLRSYYFLLDGEYCSNVTRELFTLLYSAGGITTLPRRLSYYGDNIRFCVTSKSDLLDTNQIDALDGICLVYGVKWPLNIVLPRNTLAKYDEIFKFLLKLHRVAWVLKSIFVDLKMLEKRYLHQPTFLSFSPHYQNVQRYRHIMTHFIQTFQNYIAGEVLQRGWVTFQDNLESIDNLDDLYSSHDNYLNQIYFLCLLNPKSAPVKKVVMNILTVILKFHDYLRSREWTFDECEIEHPNFSKLEAIFANFMALAKYFFTMGRKIAHAAYQPQFAQLIDMLDINGYYSACSQE